MTTILNEANQITVPEQIVLDMRLTPGTQIEWTPGTIPGTFIVDMVAVKRRLLKRAQEIGKSYVGRNMIDELIEERMRDDIEEYGEDPPFEVMTKT